jgi:hypothetical protein
MSLRCHPQLRCFSHALPTNLLSCLLVGTPMELAGAPVPRQFLLEGERAPGPPRFDLLSPQPQHHQVGHQGNCDRALHPRRILGDLVLPQPDHAFQFFNTELHRPSSQIQCHRQVRGCVRRLVTSSFVWRGLSLRRRRLSTTVTSPTCANCACLAKLQKTRRRARGTTKGTRTWR